MKHEDGIDEIRVAVTGTLLDALNHPGIETL